MFAAIRSPHEDPAALAAAFSPWVERVAPDTVLFSINELSSLHGNARGVARAIAKRAPEASIAIAAFPDTAVLAARHLNGVVIIPPGEEMRYLGSLALECLPLDPETWQILDRWGLRTFEDLACLPENGLHARLGESGVRLQRLARGALGRPLKPLIPETVYEESIELEYAIELAEPLQFLIARFLHSLCARLKSQSMAAGELHLRLNASERSLRLPFPTRDVKFLLRLIDHSLDTDPPGEAITRVALKMAPAEPRLIQHDLFTIAAPEPERLELTLGKIRGMVGETNVRIPEIRDTWRPGWGRAESRLVLRHFRPPLEAQVEVASGAPRRVRARGVQGAVLERSGPWRTSGEWWRPDTWNRDEWDLALSDGAIYRVCLNLGPGRWFVEGEYD